MTGSNKTGTLRLGNYVVISLMGTARLLKGYPQVSLEINPGPPPCSGIVPMVASVVAFAVSLAFALAAVLAVLSMVATVRSHAPGVRAVLASARAEREMQALAESSARIVSAPAVSPGRAVGVIKPDIAHLEGCSSRLQGRRGRSATWLTGNVAPLPFAS